MTVNAVKKKFRHMQNVFRMAAFLQLSSHLWPKSSIVEDGAVYDYIVVGGGTAGCVIASRLIEMENVTVLLIEAGGNPPWEASIPKHFPYLKHTTVDWNVTSTKERCMQKHNGGVVEIPQGKMLGGTSSLNYMVYEHGNPVEYTTWASIVKSTDWVYDELLPYFKQNEKLVDKEILTSPKYRKLHGTDGKMKLVRFNCLDAKRYLKAYEELGIPRVLNINSRTPIGVSKALFNCGSKTRQSTAYSFLRHVKDNPRLHVMTNALVNEIIVDSRNTAIGVKVECSNPKKVINVTANAEIILSAGVFRTPQLLMLSGIGPKKHLTKHNIKVRVDLPVGQNLRDAPAVLSVFKMGNLTSPNERAIDPNWVGFSVINSAIAVNHSENFPDYTIRSFILNDPQLFLTLCAVTFTYTKELCEKIHKEVRGKQIYVTLNHLAYPTSRGKVTLVSKKIHDQPIIQLGLYANNHDLTSHALFLAHFHTILNTSHFEKVSAEVVNPQLSNCRIMDLASIKYWKCYALSMATTTHNNYGTCAMGSVVDERFVVRGVNGLRVVDASVIPTAITSPILAAVVMLAEKAANIIKNDYFK